MQTQTGEVPAALMRTGNFSELLSPTKFFYGKAVTVYDPSTCPSTGAASCQAFPDNVIPTSMLSPNGLAILTLTRPRLKRRP